MDTGQTSYQQLDHQQEPPVSQPSDLPNLQNDTNSLTPAQRRERISSLVVIALISLLTGKKFFN
jgi:hypothetical protein